MQAFYLYTKIRILAIFIIVALFGNFLNGQIEAVKSDRELVYEAVEDYVLALYEVAPDRIAKSVDPSLRKIGYYDYDGKAQYHIPMTYDQLFNLASSWNKDGNQVNSESPKKIEIYQIHDRTASAKLTAIWGIDFMHLSKSPEGNWKIMNIMWQATPK